MQNGLKGNIDFFQIYIKFYRNEPQQFWLGAFTFPTGFLTAVLQRAARNNNVPIDILSWEFVVLQEEDQTQQMIKEGVLIRNLYLEGAR